MDKDEGSNDGGGGGGEPDKSKDIDKSPEIIEVKEDSQDGGKSSPIAVESPTGSRWVEYFYEQQLMFPWHQLHHCTLMIHTSNTFVWCVK